MIRIQRAKEAASYLLKEPNVVGVGVGYKVTGGEMTNELSVIVSVVAKVSISLLEPQQIIPMQIAGIRTDVQQTGRFVALRTGRWRPAPGGVSIGHKTVTAGTLGCLVRRGSETFILSNNHVMANSNQAQMGDEILQPGAADGGQLPGDLIATLEDFVHVEFALDIGDCPVTSGLAGFLNLMARLMGSKHRLNVVRESDGVNLVDAAIARPVAPVINEILEVGIPAGAAEVELGAPVLKSGRTTGLTRGKVTQKHMTLQVMYPPTGIAVFEDQVAADCESTGGDSGSVVLDEANRVVGLLFAGGEGVTVFNRIQNVADALGVKVES